MTEAVARHLGRVPHADDPSAAFARATSATTTTTCPRSPLVGEVSPLAPPIEWELVDGRIVGHGTYHAAYEGPPGYVHGGWVALTFDEILGMANIASGHPGHDRHAEDPLPPPDPAAPAGRARGLDRAGRRPAHRREGHDDASTARSPPRPKACS